MKPAKKNTRKKRVAVSLSATLVLMTGIASLWFAIAYTDAISFKIHAAASHLLLADEDAFSSSDNTETDTSSYNAPVNSAAPDVKKVFDTTPPVIVDAAITGITATAASVSWRTNEFATSSVRYGRTEAYESISIPRTHLDQMHAIQLSGLLPRTKYYVEVTSRDHDGNVSFLGGLTFVTLDAPASVHAAASTSMAASSSKMLTCDFLQKQTESAMKRGTFALAVFKALGLKAVSNTRQLYKDIPVTHPSFQAVVALQRAGLMQGYSSPVASRLFGANDAITPATKLIVIQRAQKKGLCE